MLITEWDTEEAKVVWYEDGLEDGLEKGREEGREEGRRDMVRAALAQGLPMDMIQKLTGFDIATIQNISAE